jgi:hypothetical protein
MSQKKKVQFDYDSPEVRAMVDEVVHGTFMKEGTMVAFPTCFPGASIPITPDESHITALDVTPNGVVYGGCGGKRAHIFAGMFHGVTGMVFDLMAVEGATHCAAVCCGHKKVFACVNGPGGGRILAGPLQPLPFDLIQEWGFERPPFEDLGHPVPGELVLHAVPDSSREVLIGTTTRHLFTLDMETSKVQVVAEVAGAGRLGLGSGGGVFGLDGPAHLWRFDPRRRSLERKAVRLPQGVWDKAPLFWARDTRGLLYTADGGGHLFSFGEDGGFRAPLGKTPVAPVGPMAATLDGRLFGFCGEELAKMFCYDPRRRQVADLGVAVSVIERRRYGYVFGDAVTGRDGEIVFGENDDFRHLWLYFPKIVA